MSTRRELIDKVARGLPTTYSASGAAKRAVDILISEGALSVDLDSAADPIGTMRIEHAQECTRVWAKVNPNTTDFPWICLYTTPDPTRRVILRECVSNETADDFIKIEDTIPLTPAAEECQS